MLRVLGSQFPVLRRNNFLDVPSSERNRGLGTFVLKLGTGNWELRTSFHVLLACVLAVLASVAHAQQIDFGAGASTLWSTGSLSASQAFIPPALKGGTFANASLQYLGERRLGWNLEGAARVKEGLYNGYQFYRPILYDANAVYARRMAPKFRADLMAGVGGETLIFYNTTNCTYANGCRLNVNSTHFLLHFGVGLRYYFWRTFFIRPEGHYYFIPNNSEFNSDHVFRMGASIGHTFGSR
jgi:hypothetical protein